MSAASQDTTPREPEIELLGRIARGALWTLRGAMVAGGLFALGHATWGWLAPAPAADPEAPAASLSGVVWLCIGLPPLLPVRVWFGPWRWPLLAGLALLWFVPTALGPDIEYGWILRTFATGVALSVLLVWRTAIGLVRPAAS
ncbi:MAG: hypothetical protein JNK49_21125 [Planctomycetes bacterium]|nr:hypothetical protein [Planctomycetota bacterium]